MSSKFKANRGLTLAFAAMTVVSVAAVAQTSGSPFAIKKKKQAWETDTVRPGPTTPAYVAPAYVAPQYQAPEYSSPQNAVPQYTTPKYIPPPNYKPSSEVAVSQPNYSAPSYTAPKAAASLPSGTYSAPTLNGQSYSLPKHTQSATVPSSYSAPVASQQTQTSAPPVYGSYQPHKYRAPQSNSSATEPELLPGYRRHTPGQAGAYYPGRENNGGFSVPASSPRGQTAQNYNSPVASPQYDSSFQARSAQPPQSASQNYGGPNQRPQYGPQSWKSRLGLGNLLTTFSAALKVGVAAVQRKNTPVDEGWNEGFIADGKVSGEISAITRGGLEYGVGGEIRGQYDKYRRGFGGMVGECGDNAINTAGCNSLIIDGLSRPLRGHTSQFYNSGVDNAKETEFALEGAYLFLRSAYGDVTVGRDDGAAYLFSLGAPTLLAVNASNSPVDYTGLDSVRTVNEASGFSEKIAYVSPRLLGDQIGLGVQIGASYAPNARACGVDYCVRANGKDGSTALSPDLENVIEFGVALDRTFSSGLSIEGTATYAAASEESGLAGFDDLKSFGLGLEAEYGPWTLGGSFLNSNNGLINGDYEAYDIGLTFKPAQWGVSASYGHATDKNVNLLSDQATLGFIYDFDRFTLGTGVQYIERDVVGLEGGLFAPQKEKATALFIEGGIKF